MAIIKTHVSSSSHLKKFEEKAAKTVADQEIANVLNRHYETVEDAVGKQIPDSSNMFSLAHDGGVDGKWNIALQA
eukprot:2299536-Pleurochrysis_carterae.AAC.1